MRSFTLAATVVFATGSQSATPMRHSGLWYWHAPWTSAPAEIVEETGPNWYTSGLLLNLCEDGRLRMATGVFYRSTGPAVLGVSDGLSLYQGTWRLEGESIVARYRLVDSEIRFTGMEAAMSTERVEHLRIEDGALLFAFEHPGEVTARNLRLSRSPPGAPYVEDSFVECRVDAKASPRDKSLERTRER